jgi:hypothetical protein
VLPKFYATQSFKMSDASTSVEKDDLKSDSIVAGAPSEDVSDACVQVGTLRSPIALDSFPVSTTSPMTMPPDRTAAKRGRPRHTALQQAEAACKRAKLAYERAKEECEQRRDHIHKSGELWDAPSIVARVKESYQKQVDKVAALFVEYQQREQACSVIEWEDARKLAYDEGFKAGQESMQQSCMCIACLRQI